MQDSLSKLRRLSPISGANAALTVLMISILLYCCIRTLIDPDLYWHLTVGMDICRTGVIVAKDTYSFLTSDQRWVNHEWLSDLIFGYIYLHLGWAALVLFKAFIVALMLAVVYIPVSKWEFDIFGKSLLILAVAFFASPATNCIRPHVFTCLFLAIIFVLVRIAKDGKHQALWLLPPLFVLWVNLHGGFVVGLATFLIWISLETLPAWRNRKNESESRWFYWLIFALCCATTLLTPYGYAFPLFMINAATMPRPDVSEWQPIPLLSPLGALWAAMIFVTLVSLVLSKKPKDTNRIVLWLIFAAAPLISIRHLQFFGMATAVLVGEHLASAWQQRKSQTEESPDRKWVLADGIFVVISLTLAIGLFASNPSQIANLKLVPGEDVPEHAVALLKRIKAHGNMVVNFDWGGYAIWFLAPPVKVSFDGRMEFAYSPSARMANTIFTSGFGPWDSLLQKFPIDIVLVRTTTPSYNLMKLKPGWKLAYEDDLSAIFFPVGSDQAKKAEELLHSLPDAAKSDALSLPLL
jgi:hypothetical protein